MPRKDKLILVSPEQIERQIYVVRGQRVMVDSDLAELYGTTTTALNQAIRRNRDRFPDDFSFVLTQQEVRALLSQIVIAKKGRGGRTNLLRVFTEQGVAMLSSVLRSPTAVKVNIEIMRAFVRLRKLFATPGELITQLNQLADTVQLHDDQIKVITEVLKKMMQPPQLAEPKRQFGFHLQAIAHDGHVTTKREPRELQR